MTDIGKPGTPLPWVHDADSGGVGITVRSAGDPPSPIAEIWINGDDRKANAAYIVHAANSYPLLVDALERLDRLFAYPVSTEIKPRGWDIRPVDKEGVEYAVEIIRRALAQDTRS